nr:PREDICTED: protein TIFY 10b-like isoform X2 [Musa acuminata subsp. malaccensis]
MVQGGERSVRKTSHFSLTCRLLSQYLKKKKKKNGNRGELALRQQAKENSLVPNTVSFEPGVDVSGKNHHRHAENSILTKEESNMATNTKEKRKDQFTVFYGGKVVVFDNIPADRAKDLMLMASKDTTCNLMTLQPQANNSSDMPIARRNSLHRFLEKRKDRFALIARDVDLRSNDLRLMVVLLELLGWARHHTKSMAARRWRRRRKTSRGSAWVDEFRRQEALVMCSLAVFPVP